MPYSPNTTRLISSRNNIHIRRIRDLHLRSERERTHRYYIEGIRFIAQALRYHAPIETLVVSPPLLTSPFANKLIHHLQSTDTPLLEVSPEVMHSLALVDDPQGIGAVLRQKWLPLERVKLAGKLCWIAVDTVQSPGNLGSILRTSDAVGAAGLILLDDSTDPYDPATIRASMGAMFSQRFVRTTSENFVPWKESRQWSLVGTSPHAEVDYHQITYERSTVLLLGGEMKGLPEDLQNMCDLMVRIPMVGRTDSLNVAVAAGVLLYELFNQRRTPR